MILHPEQPKYIDNHGTERFLPNKIVRHLLAVYPGGLNHVATSFLENEKEDYKQLLQLIGYSVSGYYDVVSSLDEDQS